jgi:hypothetical protein
LIRRDGQSARIISGTIDAAAFHVSLVMMMKKKKNKGDDKDETEEREKEREEEEEEDNCSIDWRNRKSISFDKRESVVREPAREKNESIISFHAYSTIAIFSYRT